MASDLMAAAGKGATTESKESLMEQVAEYVRVSKETSQVAYDLACMAQDLGSLWTSKRKQDEKSAAAETMINKMVGDRIPYTFGRRGSDTIPSGLAALSNFLSEDPRHFGVRLSTLFTGSNFIQERRKVTAVNMPTAADMDSSSSESEISSSSRSSNSGDSGVSSLSSEEMNNFDAHRWYQKVDKLVSTIQSKEEWETIQALREGYSFKDTERAADLVHVEALADLNDEELRGYESTKEKLETQVEAKQLEMLAALTTFSESLKKTTREVIRRRRARKRVKKKFSFSNMDEVRFVVKDGEDDVDETKHAGTDNPKSTAEVDSIKGHRAGELLTQISGLQSNMNELVRDAHLKKQTLEVHQKALSFLESALQAAEGGDDPPEPDKDIQDLLHIMQAEAKELVDLEKRQAATARLKEVSEDGSVFTEEHLKDMEPKQLKVHLTQFENDVEMLQKKVQELETARIAEARGGAERALTARKAALFSQQHREAEGNAPAPGDTSRRTSLMSPGTESSKTGRASPAELRRRLISGDVPPPSKLVAALEEQVPAAQQAVEALDAHKALFLKSVEKAQELKERFSLDLKEVRRSFLAGQESTDQASELAPLAPAGSPAASAAKAAPAPAASEKNAEAASLESPRRRRASRSQAKPLLAAESQSASSRPPSRPKSSTKQVSGPADAASGPGPAVAPAPAPGGAALEAASAPAAAGTPPHGQRSEPRARRHSQATLLEGSSHQRMVQPTEPAGLPEGTGQQMKALKEATKACNAAHHDMHRLGKLLDLDLEKMADAEAKVMLRAKQLGSEKKQVQIEELQAELQDLQKRAGIEPTGLGAEAGALSPKSATAGSGFPGSPSSVTSPRMDEFQKAKLDQKRVIEELLKMEGAMNPELLKELLTAQGENLHIQEQLVNLDEALRLVRAKGKDLTKEEQQKIKEMLAPEKQLEDPGDPQVQELQSAKRRMRGLQKEVQGKRGEWSGIEGVSRALQGLGEGVNPAEVLRKVRMINAANARQNSSEDNSPVNRTSTHPEIATLQAAAAMARTKDARAMKAEQEGLLLSPGSSSPRTPATSTSATAQLLKDAVSTMAADAKGKASPRKQGARRASANDLVSLNVPMHVAINLRRRQSLAAGLKVAAQRQSDARLDVGQAFAISTLGGSSQAGASRTAQPAAGRHRRATDAEVPPPRRYSGFTGGGHPRRVSIA